MVHYSNRHYHYVSITLHVLIVILRLSSHSSVAAEARKSTNHKSNVAILVSSSTFFHNYRHTTNTLAMYQALKKHGGFTDDNIILFLADEVACNARNPFKNTVYPYSDHELNLYDEDVEVDYIGSDVTVENLWRVLLGRHDTYTPSNQRLLLKDIENTNLFLYITGHGGDNFFKFRDQEDFSTEDLRGAFDQLQIMQRFNSVLFVADTCQAFTLAPNTPEMNNNSDLFLKNVYSIGTSLKGESSYAHHTDKNIGHSVMDRYVYHFINFMGSLDDNDGKGNKKWHQMNKMSIKEAMIDSMYSNRGSGKKLGVDLGWTDFGCDAGINEVPLSEFLVMKQEVVDSDVELVLDQVDFFS
mmetsp:Transcript_16992/g.19643  ORF Transcript_16992/g.19643 Transcript_16992/m.19643 type:complete len:355 (+) Transcript_16992:40-1104(+)